jgi:hypothetical protein
MRRNAIRPGVVVVDGAGAGKLDTNKAPDGPLERQGLGVDYINPGV